MSAARAKAKQPTKLVVGKVRVQEWQSGRWRIRYCDPATGKDIQLRLNAANLTEAMQDAELHNRYIRGETASPPHEVKRQRKEATALTVEDAMTKAEARLNYNAKSLAHHQLDAARLREFAEGEGVTRWKLVTGELIRKYYQHMKDCDLSHDTIRLRLLPISITAGYWALESDEYTDEFRRAKINHKRPRGYEPDIAHLTLGQARAYLQHLKEHCAPKFHAMAMIGFYTGMRQLEVASLRTCDVDVRQGIITVTDTETHDVKTQQSKRRVPVPEEVLACIREWPIEPEGLLFRTNGGCAYDANMLSKEWRKHVLKKARAEGIVPAWFTAKKARPTFATLAGEAGVEEVMLQKMMGHAPSTVMAKFYRHISPELLKANLVKFWKVLTHGPASDEESAADAG